MKTKQNGEFTLREAHALKQGEAIDPAQAGIKLVGPATWKDGSPVKLVWIQVAETGRWKGHGAGEFEMTSSTFEEIVRNFNARGLPIQWDQEHSSESDPTSGTIPITGAPAQGWIHRLDNRGPAGLWGLTEWLDAARDGIKAGKFAFCSPAIRFGCKDGVTGKEIGARLTSVAITGQPFLTGLEQLVAASDRGDAPLLPRHHAGRLRTALSGHNCTARQCCDLRDAASGFLGCYDDADRADGGDGATMPMSDRLVRAEGEAARATLLLRERDERIVTQDAELVELRADKVKRDEAECAQAAENAYYTYRDIRKLTEAQRPLMLKFAKADRASFDAMYPPTRVDHMYLMRELVPPARRELPDETPGERVRRSMREEGLTQTEAELRKATGRMDPGDQGDLAAIRAVMRDTGISFTEATLRAAGARPRAR